MSAKDVPIATYLDAAMRKRGDISNSQLGAFVGVSHVTVGRWRKGEDIPSSESCRLLANYFHDPQDLWLGLAGHRTETAALPPRLSYTELLRRAEEESPASIPIVDQLGHAGEGAVAQDFVYLPKQQVRNRNLKAIRVKGDCMEPTVSNGDLIIVDLDGSPIPGDIVVALIDRDDVQVKRFARKLDGHVILSCDNPAYPEVEVEDVRIQGVVIQSSKIFKG